MENIGNTIKVNLDVAATMTDRILQNADSGTYGNTTTTIVRVPRIQTFSDAGVIAMSGLLVFLSLTLVVLVVHIIRTRPRGRPRRRRHRSMASIMWSYVLMMFFPERHKKQYKRQVRRRYETIEGWTITKKVQAHGDYCRDCRRHHQLPHGKKGYRFASDNGAGKDGATAGDNNGGADVQAREESRAPPPDTVGSSHPEEESAPENRDVEEGGGGESKYCRPCHLSSSMNTASTCVHSDTDDSANVECKGSKRSSEGGSGSHSSCRSMDSFETADMEFDVDEEGDVEESRCRAGTGADQNCGDDSFTNDDGEYEERECPICMEEMRVGHIVTWSPSTQCEHVFHHECIKEWLLRHVECPFCRQVFMPVDNYRGKAKGDKLKELMDLHTRRNATTYYCQREGLVTLAPTVSCTNAELEKMKHLISVSIVFREDLAKLRGHRQEGTTKDLTTSVDAIYTMSSADGTASNDVVNVAGGGVATDESGDPVDCDAADERDVESGVSDGRVPDHSALGIISNDDEDDGGGFETDDEEFVDASQIPLSAEELAQVAGAEFASSRPDAPAEGESSNVADSNSQTSQGTTVELEGPDDQVAPPPSSSTSPKEQSKSEGDMSAV